jgi:CHASE2 domain-containing sensor protein
VAEAPIPVVLLVTAAAALVALVAAPLAPSVGTLVLGIGLAGALAALRMGWWLPLAAPLATLAAAVVAARLLGRPGRAPPGAA